MSTTLRRRKLTYAPSNRAIAADRPITPENVLDTAPAAIDRISERSEPYDGLFPSLLDRETGETLTEMPEPISGQRNWDRVHLGSTPVHDEPL